MTLFPSKVSETKMVTVKSLVPNETESALQLTVVVRFVSNVMAIVITFA